MSSSISILESPLAYTLSLDMSPVPVTCQVQEPRISILPPPNPTTSFMEPYEIAPPLSRFSSELLLLLIEQVRNGFENTEQYSYLCHANRLMCSFEILIMRHYGDFVKSATNLMLWLRLRFIAS